MRSGSAWGLQAGELSGLCLTALTRWEFLTPQRTTDILSRDKARGRDSGTVGSGEEETLQDPYCQERPIQAREENEVKRVGDRR